MAQLMAAKKQIDERPMYLIDGAGNVGLRGQYPEYPLGSRMITPDGRVWRYVKWENNGKT